MAIEPLGQLTPTISEPVAAPGAATGASVADTLPLASMPSTSPDAMLLIAHQVGQGLKAKAAGLDYRIDMINGTPRIRIIDSQTMQIIRQIPSDEVLTIHHSLGSGGGLLVKQKV